MSLFNLEMDTVVKYSNALKMKFFYLPESNFLLSFLYLSISTKRFIDY